MAKRRRNSHQPDPRNLFKINDQIKVQEVRLVGNNMEAITASTGKKLTTGQVFPTRKVRAWADLMGLDVVLISPKADPPVVRIVDFNKFLYERKKKEKELKAKTTKTIVKEIRFGPNTDDHDINFKLRHARSFLEEGAKVKAYVHFKGRSIVFKERGELLLLNFLKELEDVGIPENLPKMEGRRMIVIISPKKKKKG